VLRQNRRATTRRWRDKHPEKCAEASRRCRAKHPERYAERNRRWKAEHPERYRDHRREWLRRARKPYKCVRPGCTHQSMLTACEARYALRRKGHMLCEHCTAAWRRHRKLYPALTVEDFCRRFPLPRPQVWPEVRDDKARRALIKAIIACPRCSDRVAYTHRMLVRRGTTLCRRCVQRFVGARRSQPALTEQDFCDLYPVEPWEEYVGSVEKVCEQCHRLFFVIRSHADKSRFCSTACSYKAVTKPRPEVTCQFCGRTFHLRRPSDKQAYCSRECVSQARKLPKEVLREHWRENRRKCRATHPERYREYDRNRKRRERQRKSDRG
jgi:hypothetical protein